MERALFAQSKALLTERTPESGRTMFDRDVISFAHGAALRRYAIPAAIRSRAKAGQPVVRYADQSGLLQEMICERQRAWYHAAYPACALGLGVTSLVRAIARARGVAGQSPLLVAAGYYHGCVRWASSVRMPFVPVRCDTLGHPDLDELKRLLELHPAATFLFANPGYLGTLLDRNKALALAELITSKNCFLIEDTIFSREIHCSGEQFYVSGFLPENYPSCIVDSAAKSYGLNPTRIGWLLGPRGTVDAVNKYLFESKWMPALEHQELLRNAIEDEAFLKQNREELGTRRALVHECIERLNIKMARRVAELPFPDGGSHSTLIRIHVEMPACDPLHATRQLLEQARVACSPGVSHGMRPNEVRINYSCASDRLGKASTAGRPADSSDSMETSAKPDFAVGRDRLIDGLNRLATGIEWLATQES